MVTLMEFTAHRRRPKGQAPQGRCIMHTRELCVTIRLDHDPSGVRAEAIFRGDDRESVTGIGQVVQHRTNPFPAREDLAVVRALHDLADRLVARGKQARPCAPGERRGHAGDGACWRRPLSRAEMADLPPPAERDSPGERSPVRPVTTRRAVRPPHQGEERPVRQGLRPLLRGLGRQEAEGVAGGPRRLAPVGVARDGPNGRSR